MADANKKKLHISPIFANFVALKKPPIYSILIVFMVHCILYFGALKLLKYYKQGKVLCKCFILAQTIFVCLIYKNRFDRHTFIVFQ